MRSACLLSAALLCPVLTAQVRAVPPPLPAEHLTVESLPPRTPHWVYVYDEAFANEIDSRVHLFDGDSYRRLGQIDGGFYTSVIVSPDGATTAVAATYFARGGHGARTDVVEFTDNSTLAVTREIVLPPKRAQTGPSLFNIAYSADAHFLYAAYMTPAASFGVLDPAQGKVLGEIDTAGCVLVIPSGPNRVSSLCESGRLLTVTLDAQGREASRAMSEPFFDADRDPVFVQGIPTARGYAFLSFLGEVHEIDFSGAQPAFAPSWSLVSAAEKGHWRPGAMQVGAIHRGLGRLYVPMHEGGEGTHKDGGTEMWVFDLASHRRLARWPLKARGLSRVIAVQVSQDAAPIVFAATEKADLAVFDALTGRLKHVEKQIGQTPWMLLNP
ncbi:MAG TPA: amine dehydrogenase large subunit [Steroidobacteraceae bacterium]|nr:amine dehydrogenase large subunit [Steroidobacteraceae bacterium]